MPKPKTRSKNKTKQTNRFSKWFRLKKNKARVRAWLVQLGLVILALIITLNLLSLRWLYVQYQQTVLSFQANPVVISELPRTQTEPIKISIPSLSLELPINPTNIEAGIWQTSDTTASHLQTSARPGENSNVVIYGHNRRSLFKKLHQLKIGDTLEITTETGKRFTYVISEMLIVSPDEIEVVLPTPHEEVTLYTCTGWLDAQRLVLKAHPVGVSS